MPPSYSAEAGRGMLISLSKRKIKRCLGMQRRNKETIKYCITEFNVAGLLCMLLKENLVVARCNSLIVFFRVRHTS
jgi:hypothetical protein